EPVDPTRPIELRVYAEDGAQVDPVKSARDWVTRADALDRETPLVVFSKTYCPYSRRAKELLESYDLSPPPRIIEVDQRGDGDLIKAILARLTGRATFPNVILKGASIGGSDTILDLHARGKLAHMLRRAGLRVRGDV
ncbi:thioredoxin-like protein, partial [Vararia minispora EC-137]